MKSVLPILLALGAVLLGDVGRVAAQGPLPAAAASQTPPAHVPEIWLMLKNGSTFAARMLSAGERVKLRVNDGDIEIRASEIALTGYSLNDLAEQQWALLHQQQIDKQFPFVDWCARYHLYEHADAALAQMERNGQDTPRVRGYQVHVGRLRKIHQEQQAAAAQLAAAPPASAAPVTQPLPAPAQPASTALPPPAAPAQIALPQPATPPAIPQSRIVSPPAAAVPNVAVPNFAAPNVAAAPLSTPSLLLPTNTTPSSLTPAPAALPAAAPNGVKPAAYQPLENPRETPAATKAALNSPNPGTLSPAAVELFAARVHPWVVSRCSNTGCHDMNGTNSYKLERYSKQEAIPRATTLKNLAATTRLILADKPEESPLLIMANRAHGTSLTPPIAAGDDKAMAAFREFVMLATGRELPKEIKPDPKNAGALGNLPGHVTPGRATFPASAADEPASENQPAKVINQNAAGWQAAIERQRAIDAETQKLKNLETNSQRANEARGLILDPAVKPAAVAAEVPQENFEIPREENRSKLPTQSNVQPEILRNLPADAKLFDNDAAKARIAIEGSSAEKPAAHNNVKPATHNAESAVVLPPANLPLTPSPHALPESLLPKSIAKSRLKPDALPPEETAPGNTVKETMTESPETTGTKNLAAGRNKPAAPPINLNRPRKKFPLPPEDTPPPKAVGTGEIKKR